jgi:putative PIN family toxin of toxin-antitoxin system
MLKAVLDTNQFVSSLLSKSGVQSQILAAWQAARFQLVISPAIIEEITRALTYPKISIKYGIRAEDTGNFIGLIQSQALIVAGQTPVEIIAEDPMDNRILACAIEGQADCIVSGDHHLLKLKHYQNIPIITGRMFVDLLDSVKRPGGACLHL